MPREPFAGIFHKCHLFLTFNLKFQLKTHSQASSKTVSSHENIINNIFLVLLIPDLLLFP